MGYLSKELLLKAYKTLSELTEDHRQGQTQIVSAIRHLLAFDMYFRMNNTNCSLGLSSNRDEFVENVKKVVNISGDYYTTNFYTTIKPLSDCGVGSNFFSAGVVNNSKQNTAYLYDYPTRGQYPLFKVKNNELIREITYYKNIKYYLKSEEIKSAFVLWVLRKSFLIDLNLSSIKKALQDFLTIELIEEMMPKEENFNQYVKEEQITAYPYELGVDNLLSLFDESNKEHKDYIILSHKYRPYLTAIKSKPFQLLAGISGTGKSRIVRELARACWDEGSEEYKAQKPENFEMIQVKPNWHDSTELIGYVSRVSGEAVYVIGDFLRFVTKAWENLDVPYFLCLDEMNLAPVEQYFAEFLSVIESRKSDGEGHVTTDPILKKSTEDWYRVLTAELTGDNEALRTQFLEEGIALPQNLIVVGTVNMDETTFSFSRKVLDRAMTIEMNEVDLWGGLDYKYERIGKLSGDMLIGKAVEGVDVYADNKEVCDIALEYLKSVNEILDKTPFKVAYRTRNEFLLYVVNNLPYTIGEDGTEYSRENVIATALDEITSMKVLSRIEGDDTKVPSSLLAELKRVIREQLLKITGEDDQIESVSLTKLDEMQERLKSGYTSFWS